MKTRQPHDGAPLTLLVQLFGRDILDRLARAGFVDVAAIARAEPERLAADSGISASQARRIIAVVEEMLGPSVAPLTSTEKEPAGRATHPKRRRPSSRRQAAMKATAPKPEAEPRPAGAEPGDPFVDDVALVAWMGFSSNTTSGRTPFSVADGILDPLRRESPAREDSRRIGAGPPPAPITSMAGTLTQSQGERTPDGGEATIPARTRTLPGSFWSFGRAAAPNPAPDDAIARPPGRSPDSEEPAGAPPRRDRHDH